MAKTDAPKTDAPKLGRCECQYWEVGVELDPLVELENDIITTGCESETPRTFAPGHDAKLKSLLIRAGVNGWEARHGRITGVLVTTDPGQAADRYGFGAQVRAGIARRLRDAERKAKLAAGREASRAAKAASKASGGAKTPKVVQAMANAAEKGAGTMPRKVAARVVPPSKATEIASQIKNRNLSERLAPKATPAKADDPRAELAQLVGADQPEPGAGRRVVAKVGRHEYEGTVLDGTLTYQDRQGQTQQREDGFRVLRDL